jgi:hypothetical protein
MSDERPFIQLPVPSEDEQRLYEEWVKRQKEEEDSEKERVVIIEFEL